MQLVGDVKGMTCFIIDDIIDTVRNNNTSVLLICFLSEYICVCQAGTICKAASLLEDHGAIKVYESIPNYCLCCGPHLIVDVLFSLTLTLFSLALTGMVLQRTVCLVVQPWIVSMLPSCKRFGFVLNLFSNLFFFLEDELLLFLILIINLSFIQVTNSIPQKDNEAKCPKLKVIS